MGSLREARKAKGVMAKAVAKHLGVSEATYLKYEKHQGSISINKAVAICDFIGASVHDIFLSNDVR